MNTKYCKKCGLEKPESDFYKQSSGYLYTHCKECHKAYHKDYIVKRRKLERAKLFNSK